MGPTYVYFPVWSGMRWIEKLALLTEPAHALASSLAESLQIKRTGWSTDIEEALYTRWSLLESVHWAFSLKLKFAVIQLVIFGDLVNLDLWI